MFKSKIPKKIFKTISKPTKKVEPDLEKELEIENVNLKKQEVRLKNEEVKLKNEEASLKKLNVLEKSFELDVWDKNRKESKEFTNLMKIMTLKGVLESCVPDDNAMPGGEMKWVQSFESGEISTIKSKLFDLINKM
jgi:hypothetical protein